MIITHYKKYLNNLVKVLYPTVMTILHTAFMLTWYGIFSILYNKKNTLFEKWRVNKVININFIKLYQVILKQILILIEWKVAMGKGSKRMGRAEKENLLVSCSTSFCCIPHPLID